MFKTSSAFVIKLIIVSPKVKKIKDNKKAVKEDQIVHKIIDFLI